MNKKLVQLEKYGVDLDVTLERFIDDEDLYISCIDTFMTDIGFEKLGEEIKAEKYDEAFDTAHTLKGVSANLGLKPLFNSIVGIVEPLRNKDYNNLDELYDMVMKSFDEFKNVFN